MKRQKHHVIRISGTFCTGTGTGTCGQGLESGCKVLMFTKIFEMPVERKVYSDNFSDLRIKINIQEIFLREID
jgi:hypothetical protein